MAVSATSRLVLKPIEAEKLAAFEVGGKAAGLLRLVALGARVPPFVVIPAYAFVSHLARPETQGPGPLRERLESVPVSPELHEALGRALATLGPGPFAVRSSMVGEDGSALSYAGQLESFLFRRGVDEVAEAVRRCWASAFAPRVLAYHARAEGAEAPSIGVIVQVMVSGRASGVVFTAHPVTGRRDHALVTGAWGLGEGVVSGLCNADDYVWEHAGREVSAQLAH